LGAAWAESSKPVREALLKLARRDSRVIQHQRTPWGGAASKLIEASIESLCGRRVDAITSFARAETLFDTCDMRLHSAVARRARGFLLADEPGRDLAEAA